ncbi:glycoside hydrolase family 3 protein [Stygiobacter electus]|uniref:beta-N-acetylhexosaminidase n=1 Tax=Stygiobacter electus TaxID=3032292 RepID=A0AAE3NYU0_9BACT|nr:glycoside hydrolase family 3 N-terminal domain-containing protein [Stygiobacter electus]MDF1611149.1 glycoside hydrolase family 3 N-terminal domain-containing protein [Stygiobacter electus]
MSFVKTNIFLFIILLCVMPFFYSTIFSQTLKEKIAQMVWVGFSGTRLNDTIKIDLSKRNIGGVILFANNISNPNQIKLLNDTIKMFAKTPPFIAVDQEGGKVARFNSTNGFANTYTAYQLGTVFNSEDSTRKQAKLMANWLLQCGFNVNLAPVADVNVNPNSPAIGKLERSFSSNPFNVYLHDKIFIEEFENKNIITCLKHFPGHGSALQDSHLGFTDISNTWQQYELTPYQNLINNDYSNIIMPGHLYNSKLDEIYPASLSKKVTTDLLRNNFGFKGVTITDGMNMQAISANYSFEDGITLAVNAGNDIILYTGTLRYGSSLAQQVINVIYNKVNDGTIPLIRIEESYNRILELKKKFKIITSIENIAKETPPDFILYQNYPNPFNSSTTIVFNLPARQNVSVIIYNQLGEKIKEILNNEELPVGENKIVWNGLNDDNKPVSSGVYLYRISSGRNALYGKMILQK